MSQLKNKRLLIAQENPKSPISEAYRTLRTNIQFSSIDQELQTIMLTSANPGDGKSTTAANLAVTYAQANKRVLIIDADLRKPTMHQTFFRSNRIGLTSVLTQQAEIHEVLEETNIPNLFLITAGPTPPNPSEILGSKRMTSFLQELKSDFDVIIVDTPPVLVVTDAQIVSTLCDGVLLVINAGEVKREIAMKAKSNLELVKAKILGVVLNNKVRDDKESYYYYYYGNNEN